MSALCGLGSCFRPAWLQRFATPRHFVMVLGALGILQGTITMYLAMTITTMEKRFKLSNQMTGIILSGVDMSQAFLSLILSYYAGRGNAPLWMGYGLSLTSLACLLLALPHFIYGPGQDALALTKEYLDLEFYNKTTETLENYSSLCSAVGTNRTCSVADTSGEKHSIALVALLFCAQIILGLGATLYTTVGHTYLDDNSTKRKTPFLFSILLSLRVLSPLFGAILASFCLRIYIDPGVTPIIKLNDPRWMGAWWIGWLILGFMMSVVALLISLFPKTMVTPQNQMYPTLKLDSDCKLPEEEQLVASARGNKPDSGLIVTMRRLLGNKILFYNYLSSISTGIMLIPIKSFLYKYHEYQFGTPPSSVALRLGTPLALMLFFGTLLSGVLFKKYKPRATYVLGWCVIQDILLALIFLCAMLVFCDPHEIQGVSGRLNFTEGCNSNCQCSNMKYEPVCNSLKNITYLTPCHAGCSSLSYQNSTKMYSNCSCSSFSQRPIKEEFSVETGPCPVDCTTKEIIYIAIMMTYAFLYGTGRVTNVIINYRCVNKRDKALAQGLGFLLVSLFAQIPTPIVLSAFIDMICVVWEKTCGRKGNCWVYNKDNLRIYLFSTISVLCLVTAAFDAKVWSLGRNTKLYSEEDEIEELKKPDTTKKIKNSESNR